MRGRCSLGLLAASAVALLAACSSSNSSPTPAKKPATDAGADAHHATTPDAAKTEPHDGGMTSSAGPDATATGVDAGRDTGPGKSDALMTPNDAARTDSAMHFLFDAFVYPEAAIPHDTGHDAPLSPCSSLPDESSYCAATDGGGSSTGFYVCMQGNGIYSPCSPGTTCVATDSGAMGIACVD